MTVIVKIYKGEECVDFQIYHNVRSILCWEKEIELELPTYKYYIPRCEGFEYYLNTNPMFDTDEQRLMFNKER